LLKKGRRNAVPNKVEDTTRINEQIRVPEIRLIGADGEQVGLVSPLEGVRLALKAGLDLVEVSPNAKPPVCRIMDYGKYRFEIAKKAKVSKANQHVVKLKEIKLHPKTADNDYSYRMKHAEDFLKKGFKVKVSMFFRGREMAHQDYGKRLLDQAKIDLEPFGEIEMDARMEGNNMTSIFIPKKGVGVKKEVKKSPVVAAPQAVVQTGQTES
jgi:translation initiation factor IF-3